MNIGELFYCSRCMREIEEDIRKCPYCGYEGVEQEDFSLLEEGVLLHEGRYELGAVIGRGGFGVTYAAWDLTLQMPVAVKEYFPRGYAGRNVTESEEVAPYENVAFYYQVGLQNFVREARLLAMLQDIRAVVKVYDCFEENHTAYIVMEYVRGKTLAQYCKEEKISSKKLLKLLRPTIDDLVRIHQAGVLHRDISPDNLIMQEDEIVKLIDFGASVSLCQENDKNYALNYSYAAPEQYESDGVQGTWTDVYGLAATLYTLLSGEDILKEVSHSKKGAWKPINKTKAAVSRRLGKKIHQGLCPDYEKRTKTMEEFRADIYHLPRPNMTRMQAFFQNLKIVLAVTLVYLLLGTGVICWKYHVPRQLQLIVQAYAMQDTSAAFFLAENYWYGLLGVEEFPENFRFAEYWYRWTADRGNPDAMFRYAYIHEQGKHVEQDMDVAVQYYENAAARGIPMAWNNLGMLYLEGNNVQKDIKKAIEYLEKAEEAGEPLAMLNLGCIYMDGVDVDRNVEKAVEYYTKAIQAGNVQAFYQMALCYRDGEGVGQSDTLYLQYCMEAAVGGDPEAMCEIGRMYEYGVFGVRDYTMAYQWYNKAAAQDYGGGYYALALLYRDGCGVEKDAEKASQYIVLAIYLGYEPADEEIRKMIDEGYGIFSKDETKVSE